jgi:5-methyltetrahydrofolate--homocysteine methyltransferase
VTDLGIDVAPETFVQAVKEEKPDILGLSALLTMTLPNMKKTVAAVQEEGLFKHLFLMVGGAPVTQAFADEAGAQGYAPDAASAVDKALELMGAVKRSDQF